MEAAMPILLPLFTFAVLIVCGSAVYFYLFAQRQERFIQYWGFCWISYSASLFILIVSLEYEGLFIIAGRKLFDMLNILFLMFGAYAFIRIRIPGYWHRFTLYLIIWLLIGLYCGFDPLSICLPLSLFQIICSVNICRVILRHWRVPRVEQIMAAALFSLWGVGKAVLSILEAQSFMAPSSYLVEIIFSNMLNISILIIYMQQSVEQLSKAEKNFRIIAENAADIIFFYALTPAPTFSYITPSVETVTGYAAREFYANPKFYLELAPASEFENISSVFNPQADTAAGVNNLIFQIIHKNGTPLWVEMNSSVLYENGAPAAVEGIIRDITPMKTAEREMIASKQSRDLLMSYISHELRIPVTAIMGYIDAIRDGTITQTSEKNRAIDIIYEKAAALNRLIQDLFQLSKLETRQFSFNFALTNALELSKTLLDKHALDIRTRNMRLKYQIAEDALRDLWVIADTERIAQVFSNLISNAIKFSPAGSQIRISFKLDSAKEHLLVSVADQGVGIEEQDLPRVFKRFFHAHTENNDFSSGLGLAISREITTAHKGSLTAKSKKGRGSVFTLALPLYLDPPELTP
jgi:PAS domain S-box-containing protein